MCKEVYEETIDETEIYLVVSVVGRVRGRGAVRARVAAAPLRAAAALRAALAGASLLAV